MADNKPTRRGPNPFAKHAVPGTGQPPGGSQGHSQGGNSQGGNSQGGNSQGGNSQGAPPGAPPGPPPGSPFDDQSEPDRPDGDNLLGGGGAQSQPGPRQPGQNTYDQIGARVTRLEHMLAPGASGEAILDAIASMSPEELIPWETCQLPSRGLYYDTWGGSSKVEVRGMGIAAEKIIANQRLAADGQSLDYLFRECVRYPDPSFDPQDLLVGDRTFLLYYLRGITHGNVYEFAVTCQNQACKKVSTHSYDINSLARTIKRADDSLGAEPFTVRLPYFSECTGRDFTVGLRFMRGRDVNMMSAMRKTKDLIARPMVRAGEDGDGNPFARNDDRVIDDTLTDNLDMIIVEMMGSRDRHKIRSIIAENKLHSRDSATIREWMRKNSPGIETIVQLACPQCGQNFNMELPLTESFFRPTQK